MTTTYPGDWQNALKDNGHFYKDHNIINQPAGFIEWCNSKGIESFNIIGKDGSGFMLSTRQFALIATKLFKADFLSDATFETKGSLNIHSDKDLNITHLGDSMEITGDVDKSQKYCDQIKSELKPLHDKKQLFEIKRTKFHNSNDQSSLQEKSGTLAKTPTQDIKITILKTTSAMKWTAGSYGSCFRQLASLTDNKDKHDSFTASGAYAHDNGWYDLTSMGTGESPSTQDGKWDPETTKKDIEKDMVSMTNSLADKEKFLGQNKKPSSGNKVVKVLKNKVEMIGTTFNDLPAIRIDPVGKLMPSDLVVDPFGGSVYKTFRAVPLIERVHVDDMPGGDSVVNIGNSWNVNVGSNGIELKTSGSFDFFGTTMRLLSNQIQMNARHNLDLTAGDALFISAPNIVIKPIVTELEIEDEKGNVRKKLPANGKKKTEKLGQLLVDGNLGVVGNTIMKGGLHVEGELSIQHLTTNGEYHITEEDFEFGSSANCFSAVVGEDACSDELQMGPTYADIVDGCLIGYCTTSYGTYPVISTCAPSSVLVHPHHHMFKNAAMRLVMEDQDIDVTYGDVQDTKTVNPHDVVRAVGARNNSVLPVLAKPVYNSKTNYTVSNKFGNSNCGKSLTIINSDWEEMCVADTLPKGMGMGTEKTEDSILLTKMSDNAKKGTEKSKEFSKKLDNVSDERKNHEQLYQA